MLSAIFRTSDKILNLVDGVPKDLENINRKLDVLLGRGSEAEVKSSPNDATLKSISQVNTQMSKSLLTTNTLLTQILDEVKLIRETKSSPGKTPDAKKLSADLGVLAKGIDVFTNSLQVFNVIPDTAKEGFLTFLTKTSDILIKLGDKSKDIQEGAKSIGTIGKGILVLGASLALSAPLYAVGAAASILILPVVASWMWMFSKFSDKSKEIGEGGKSVALMGLGILALGASLSLSKTLYEDSIPTTLIAIPVIAALGLTFAILGKASKQINDGAKSVAVMSLGILAMGASIALFGKLTGDDPIETGLRVITIAASVGLLAAVFGIAGKFAAPIAKGSIAMVVAGVSLITIGYGLKIYKEAGWEMMDNLSLGATLLTLGTSMSLAGLASLPIALGAGAMILAGGALIAISYGLKKFKEVGFDGEKDGKNLATALGTIRTAFTGDNPNSDKGFFASIGSAFTGTLDSVKFAANAVAFGVAGLSLISVSKGLETFQKINWQESDSIALTNALGGIAGAFAQAGGTGGTKTSVLSFLTGIDLSPNNVERGIDSVMGAGKALTSVTQGLKAFQSSGIPAEEFVFDETNPSGGSSLLHNIYNTVNAVSSVFGLIGASKQKSTSLFSLIGGSDFSESNVEIGIESVLKTGKALTSVVEGLKAFQNSGIPSNEFQFDPTKPNGTSLLHNIYSTINAVSSVFGAIGSSKEKSTSLLSLIGGSDFSESNVEIGIESVMGTQKALTSVTEGLKAWKNSGIAPEELVFDPANQKNLIGTVYSSLTAIKSVFAEIGKSDGSGSLLKSIIGTDFSSTDVERGIESTEEASKVFKRVVDGFKIIKDIGDPTSLAKNAGLLISSVPTSMIEANKLFEGSNIKDPNAFFTKYVNNMTRFAKLDKPFANIAKSLGSISKSMSTFAVNFDGTKMNVETIKAFDSWSKGIIEFSKIETKKLEEKTKESEGVINKALDFGKNLFKSQESVSTTKATEVSTQAQTVKNTSNGEIKILQSEIASLKNELSMMTSILSKISMQLSGELLVKQKASF